MIPCIGRQPLAGNPFDSAWWGSIAPAAWSFMLAARARGLGSVWTSLHLFFEEEAAELLGIPYDEVMQAALIPVAHSIGTDFQPGARNPTRHVRRLGTLVSQLSTLTLERSRCRVGRPTPAIAVASIAVNDPRAWDGRWWRPDSGGGRQALAAVYDRYGAVVHASPSDCVGVDRAKDVTQEVFVQLWRHPETYRADAGGLRGVPRHDRSPPVDRPDAQRATTGVT